MKQSILLNTDSYKASMFVQYPENTQTVYSYIESRGGRYNEVVMFGLQAFIQEYLLDPITMEDVEFAKEIWEAHGEPFNYEGWKYIVEKHYGMLPVRIKAAPEGMPIAVHNIMVSIENTDPECFWLTTFLETALLRAVWYPSTVATNSREIKKIIKNYLEMTGDVSGLPFKLHDFGARGVSSNESATLGGMAHLVNFMGSDTIAGVLGAREYYGEAMAGYSIPAAEHSTITSWGRDNEAKAYGNMLKKFASPGSILAVVSDSYDVYNAAEHLWGEKLRQQVIDSGATLVIRPDSGDPVTVVTELAKILDKKFGSVVNGKGFKVLNNVRLIQGDGINAIVIDNILDSLMKAGFSADNVAFGMGGALLGAPQRDDQKFAMKCSAALINDTWVDVYKDPITDQGKRSKKGRLALVRQHGLGSSTFKTMCEEDAQKFGYTDVLETVFENGKMTRYQSFASVRSNAEV